MDSSSSTETRFSETFQKLEIAAEVPALTIVWHPDVRRVGERVTLGGLATGDAVELSRCRPLFAARRGIRRALDVVYLSRTPLRLSALRRASERSGISEPVDLLIERGDSATPVEIDGEPLDEQRRITADSLESGVVLTLGSRVVLLLHRAPLIPDEVPRFGLVGDSQALQAMRRDIALAATTDASVLLRGASGTGKERVARAVHEAGPRRGGPWVAVNMAAIPPSLAAAELFGSVKGAYTGADRRRDGYFVSADGGTLFLDEIGDTPSEIQPLLLRALESGEIQPVGSATSRRVDVRVIAATDVDLESRLADGRFRMPLLHRLAGFEIHLPALAARRDDIGRLLVHFLAQEMGGLGELARAADPEAQRAWPPAPVVARLAAADWPGNVRQLANIARRLALAHSAEHAIDLGTLVDSLLARGDSSGPAPLLARSSATAEPSASAATPGAARPNGTPSPGVRAPSAPTSASPTGRWRPVYRKATEVTDDELVDALRAADFELTPAAETLGVSRAVLYRLIDRCPRVRKAADLERREIESTLEHQGDEIAAARRLEVSVQGLRLRMKALGLR
ncbi:MAG: sigma 54-interacting transcriptional regulator [Acidobacteriota bacterium]